MKRQAQVVIEVRGGVAYLIEDGGADVSIRDYDIDSLTDDELRRLPEDVTGDPYEERGNV
jgi:hypothetical protein